MNSPVIIQLSNGGGQFMAGKSVKDKHACAAGCVALAIHVRAMAPYYGIPVILHTDHCAKKLTPWFEALLEANEEYFKQCGEPLFSSHMLDLSEEPDEENIAICSQYLKRMAPMKIWLEMEIGITGGEEDGVDNSDVDQDKLYTSPEQVWNVYQALSPISDMFSIAAAFGNVHGVYKPGNVKLSPERLAKHQAYAVKQLGDKCTTDKPIFLVMHGGSGSTDQEIKTSVEAGVIKMNVDTDTQWAYWDGVRQFVDTNKEYLQGQMGNPQGPDAPNKKYYDPRAWIRKGEECMAERCAAAMKMLGCNDTFPTKKPESGSIPIFGGFSTPRPTNPVMDALSACTQN